MSPPHRSLQTVDPNGPSPAVPLEIDLGAALQQGGSLRVTLIAGLDAGAAEVRDISNSFVINGRHATASLATHDVPAGRNTVHVGVDRDGNGSSEFIVTSTFELAFDVGHTIARQWNEVLLDAIRLDTPRPTVHARNLFHLSAALWDCWVAYDQVTAAVPFIYGNKHGVADVPDARHRCMSIAAHRLLKHRFQQSISAVAILADIDAKMTSLGYPTNFNPAGWWDTSPEAVGARVGQFIINAGMTDGANEANDYADPTYFAYNDPLIFAISGTNDSIWNPNLWTPLAFDFGCFQNGLPVPDDDEAQVFVGSNWNDVAPFALTRNDPSVPYYDPGQPPQAVAWDWTTHTITGAGDLAFKEQMLEVVRYSSRLDPDDAPWINVSPGVHGNHSLAGIANGVLDGAGYGTNPVTGLPYASNWVNQADYGRVLAEFWADGPDSETPPGHWNTLANYVSDHPLVEKRIRGQGPIVSDLEWDVKLYLAINGAVHDSAIAAWGAKRIYDYARPIASIRWLSEQGQSSDPNLPFYSEHGMLLEPGLSELITLASSAAGKRHEHLSAFIGEVAVNVWPGEPDRALPPACGDAPTLPPPGVIIAPYSGREWILGKDWTTYQKRTFVTPPFAAYISGHSTFSRAAAEVLRRITDSAYFPGGLGEFIAPQNDFLVFEQGPTQTVRLQWATYFDAADEAGISRLWGGIHVSEDDFEGRLVGSAVGTAAFDKAEQYWDGTL